MEIRKISICIRHKYEARGVLLVVCASSSSSCEWIISSARKPPFTSSLSPISPDFSPFSLKAPIPIEYSLELYITKYFTVFATTSRYIPTDVNLHNEYVYSIIFPVYLCLFHKSFSEKLQLELTSNSSCLSRCCEQLNCCHHTFLWVMRIFFCIWNEYSSKIPDLCSPTDSINAKSHPACTGSHMQPKRVKYS